MNDMPPVLMPEQLARFEAIMREEPTAKYMAAARADGIPKGEKWLWRVTKVTCPHSMHWPAGDYTALLRYTDATLYSGGKTVMADNPVELSKHLEPAMLAKGRVLVTGLGLGCVLRMLQANPRVESITLVEVSRDVIDLVWPHTSHDRVELIHADAVDFLRKTKRTWDYAWHDLWTDESIGQPPLQVVHQWLMFLCAGRVKWQGAWAFPQDKKRAIDRIILPKKRAASVREATRKIIRERDWKPIVR